MRGGTRRGMRGFGAAATWMAAWIVAPTAPAQVVNPGDAQRPPEERREQPLLGTRPMPLPAPPGELTEEQPVGPYKQPEWTTHRRLPSTRVYVQQTPGQVEFEQWFEIRVPKDTKKDTKTRLREEFEFGLGDRWQLDLYLHTQHTRGGKDSKLEWRAFSTELRYALADWDEIPGNPTLYFEYIFKNGDPDVIEPKLLLGGEIARGWHWGTNFVYERELAGWGDRDEEAKATAGVAYTLIDQKLSLGAEMEFSYEAEHNDANTESEQSVELLVGPSLQWRPHPKAHFDLAPLWGIGHDAKRAKVWVVFGWDF